MRFFKAFINLFNQTIYSLENSKAPFIYFVFTFFFAVTLRNFLEMFSSYFPLDPLDFIHTYLSYVSLAMILILLLCLFTRTDILKIAKTVLPSFIILNSVPILDLILSKGKGYEITYLFPGIHNNLILRFFTFFGDFPGMGITPGMRIEIGLGLVGSFIYFYFKNLKLIKSLFFTILVYVCIFSYTALPFFITGTLKLIKLKPVSSDLLFINFYLFIIFLTGTLLIYVTKRKYFQIIIKDLMPLRILHYELLFLLGLILGMKYKFFTIDCINIFYFIFVPISIAFAWLFSVIINNIEDCEIDKVSNKERPFVKSEINIENYKKLGWIFLGLALFYAGVVNFPTFFIISLFIGNYFLYSAPPLRIKRIPFFSKLLISLNSLILIILGFFIITGSIINFPWEITIVFLIGATAVANFIDIKDYEGDKKVGVKTLPVILGIRKAKFLISLFFILTYLSVYFLIKDFFRLEKNLAKISFFFYLLTLGLIQFCLINKKDYKEKHVFLVTFFSLITLIIIFFLF